MTADDPFLPDCEVVTDPPLLEPVGVIHLTGEVGKCLCRYDRISGDTVEECEYHASRVRKAVAAERERCARIALAIGKEKWDSADTLEQAMHFIPMSVCADEIAVAILQELAVVPADAPTTPTTP